MRNKANLFGVLLITLLALGLMPSFATGDGSAENQYADFDWYTSISKQNVAKQEGFYSTLDLLRSTIKRIPGEDPTDPIDLTLIIAGANSTGGSLTVSFDIIAYHNPSNLQINLWSDTITENMPKIRKDANTGNYPPIEFINKRIPSQTSQYMQFPSNAPYGTYTLFVKMTKIEVSAIGKTIDGTQYLQDFLPPTSFEVGIEMSTISLTGGFNLITSISSPGSGTITANPQSPYGYDPRAIVTLTATPATNYVFSGWSGSLTGATNPNTLTMDTDKIVTALFTLTENDDDDNNNGGGGGGGGGGGDSSNNTNTGEATNNNNSSTAKANPTIPPETVEVAIDVNGGNDVKIAPVGKDFSSKDTSMGRVEASVNLHLNTTPQNAAVRVTTSRVIDTESNSAFQLAATNAGVEITQLAYTINVTKTNLQNGTDIQSASITMKVGPEWVQANGGIQAIRIVRYDSETGQKQILQTIFKDYDSEGRAIFEGISPDGLSVFGLVATKAIPQKYSLTTAIDPAKAGTLNQGVPQLGDGYVNGTSITLSAIPNEGYVFNYWSGINTETTDSNIEIEMTSDKTITAHFTRIDADPRDTIAPDNISPEAEEDTGIREDVFITENDSSDGFPWWWLLIGIAVFAILLYFPVKRKRAKI